MTFQITPEAASIDYENEVLEYVCFQDRGDINSADARFHSHIFGIPAGSDNDDAFDAFDEIVEKHKYKPVRSLHIIYPHGVTLEEAMRETDDEVWGAVMVLSLRKLPDGEAAMLHYDIVKNAVEEYRSDLREGGLIG